MSRRAHGALLVAATPLVTQAGLYEPYLRSFSDWQSRDSPLPAFLTPGYLQNQQKADLDSE